MFTGLRRSEVLGLTWGQVDRARGVVILNRARVTKTNTTRRYSPDATGYVFPGKGGKAMKKGAFRSAYEVAVRRADLSVACKRSGVGSFTFHDLRHAFGSFLVQRGVPLQAVSDLLGHSSTKMTQRYARLAPDNHRVAVAALDGIFAVPVAPVVAPVRTNSEQPTGKAV